MTGEALDSLTRIAKDSGSLRYAMHMIMASALACRQRKGNEVEVKDVSRVYNLFSDLRRSTQFLMENNKLFMFNELETGDDDEAMGAGPVGAGAGAAMDESV
jgi:RuvB-like protein 2